jgi:hypothetical protein
MLAEKKKTKEQTPLFTYDIPTLLPGDIILSTTDSEVSRTIRLATNCDYSHAMLYVRNTIVHADGGGVFTTNPQRRMFSKGQSVVLRHKQGTPNQLMEICNHALNLSGSLYSVSEALLAKSLSSSQKKTTSQHQYCSRLVAQSYESQNIKIVNNSDYCTPADILRSSEFFVVDNAVREARPEEIAISNKPDTIKLHQTHTFSWLKEVQKLAKAKRHNHKIFSIASALDYVTAFPEVDHEVLKKIKATPYLKDYNLDKVANPHRYKTAEFSKVLLTASNPVDVVRQEVQINSHVFESAESQLKQFLPKAPQLSTYSKLAKMHFARMKQIEKRLDVIAEACLITSTSISNTTLNATITEVKYKISQYNI